MYILSGVRSCACQSSTMPRSCLANDDNAITSAFQSGAYDCTCDENDDCANPYVCGGQSTCTYTFNCIFILGVDGWEIQYLALDFVRDNVCSSV